MNKNIQLASLSLLAVVLIGCGAEKNKSDAPSQSTDIDQLLEVIEPSENSVLLSGDQNPAVIFCAEQGGYVQTDEGITICTTEEGIKHEIWEYYEEAASDEKLKTLEQVMTSPEAQKCQNLNGTVETSLDGKTALCKTSDNELVPLVQYTNRIPSPQASEDRLPKDLPTPPSVPVDKILESIEEEKQETKLPQQDIVPAEGVPAFRPVE